MKQTVAGTMLVQDGTPLPEAFVLEIAPYTAGWSSIENSTSGRLGRGLETAGWTFFYMADEIRGHRIRLRGALPDAPSGEEGDSNGAGTTL